jgi:hypothetical protein
MKRPIITKENTVKPCCNSCSKAYPTLNCKKDEMFCFNDKSSKYAQHVKKDDKCELFENVVA